MKKFLIAGSSLAAVAAAGSAGAVDVTLGGSIDMGVEYGVGKNKSGLALGEAYSNVSLSISAAGTTDAGLKYGGSFSLANTGELQFNYYERDLNGDGDFKDVGEKDKTKITVKNYTDLKAAAYNVSGGQKVDAAAIVAVKINSSWKSVSNNTRTIYQGDAPTFASSNICKVAGRVAGSYPTGFVPSTIGGGVINNPGANITAHFTIVRDNVAGTKVTDMTEVPSAPVDGYLPAGRLLETLVNPATNANENIALTLGTTNAQSKKIHIVATQPADAIPAKGEWDTDKFWIGLNDNPTNGVSTIKATSSEAVASAQVYVGPFMEVKLQSSSTKMVVGAVCITGKKTSDTAFYMDNASDVVVGKGAKIFVEGGFGKLTLQTGDYSGKVAAIGDAGDAADLESAGMVAVLEGDFMGLSAYGALTNDWTIGDDGATGSWIAGATMDLGGLAVAIDLTQSKTSYTNVVRDADADKSDWEKGDLVTISQISTEWDLGLSYAAGDLSASAALDSDGDWGITASTAVAGISVDASVYNKALDDHKKGGLMYDIEGGMSVNGLTVGGSYDQDGAVGISVGYDLGDMNLYAAYSTGDEGGKIGAKLSF